MKRIEVRKLYQGCIDIRDYDVRECIANNESAEVHHAGDVMILTPEELNNKLVSVTGKMKSKIEGGKDYALYSYRWNPKKTEL